MTDPLVKSTRLFLEAVACAFHSVVRTPTPHPTNEVAVDHLHKHLANLKQSVDDAQVHLATDAMMAILAERLKELEQNPLLKPIDGPPN